MIHRLLISVLALGALTTSGDDARAEMLFVKVEGQKQGLIRLWYNPFTEIDGVSLTDYGWVDDFAWSVISPRDPASGLPTGKRMHRPVSLRLRRSDATLLLGMALTGNENLTSVRLKWFGLDPDDGSHTPIQDLWLMNANVASFSMYTISEQGQLVTYVDVTMTYQKIGIEDPVNGVSYLDDWETPVQ